MRRRDVVDTYVIDEAGNADLFSDGDERCGIRSVGNRVRIERYRTEEDAVCEVILKSIEC